MILNEFFYKYPRLQLLIHYRLSYVAITNSVTTTQPILSVVERYQEWKWPQLLFSWKYCKTPFTALLISSPRDGTVSCSKFYQYMKTRLWKEDQEMMMRRRGVTSLRAGIYWIWHVSSWRDIFQYDEQHTKVSVEMKVIYFGLESRGKHHCQSLFKVVVRYFSSKERERERAKSANLVKTQQQNIHEISKLRWGGCVLLKLKGKHWHQIKSEGSQPAREQWGKRGGAAEAIELGGQKQQTANQQIYPVVNIR